MALVTKMGSTGRKAGDLAVGESVEGYLIGIAETKFNFAIKLLSKDGKVETLFPNGNLAYIEQEIDDGNVTLNAYTKITRSGTRQSTKSRDQDGNFRQVPVFLVAQDADDVVTAEDAASALEGEKSESSDNEGTSASKSSKFANRSRK